MPHLKIWSLPQDRLSVHMRQVELLTHDTEQSTQMCANVAGDQLGVISIAVFSSKVCKAVNAIKDMCLSLIHI